MVKEGEVKSINIEIVTILFIFMVLYLHHQMYVFIFFKYSYYVDISNYITRLAVGGYVFISGYKLTLSKTREPIISFLKKRSERIVPLYVLAVILYSVLVYNLYFDGYPTLANVVVHIFGLQSIFYQQFGPSFPILYFISLLYLYYLLFLILRNYLYSKVKFVGIVLLIVVILALFRVVLYQVSGKVFFSNNFFIYYPFFAIGMLSVDMVKMINQKRIVKYKYCLLVVSLIFSLVYISVIGLYEYLWYFFIIESALIILSLVPFYLYVISLDLKIRNIKIVKIIKLMAYSTYTVYLFHSPIWQVMLIAWSENSIYQYLYITLFGTVVIFVTSFYLQSFYDKLIWRLIRVK